MHIAKLKDIAHRLKLMGEQIANSMIITKVLMTHKLSTFCQPYGSQAIDIAIDILSAHEKVCANGRTYAGKSEGEAHNEGIQTHVAKG